MKNIFKKNMSEEFGDDDSRRLAVEAKVFKRLDKRRDEKSAIQAINKVNLSFQSRPLALVTRDKKYRVIPCNILFVIFQCILNLNYGL